MALVLPKKPVSAMMASSKRVKLISNYYNFIFTNPKKNKIFKYFVKFSPEVPDNSRKVRNKIMHGVRKQLEDYLEFFIFMGSCIYSL